MPGPRDTFPTVGSGGKGSEYQDACACSLTGVKDTDVAFFAGRRKLSHAIDYGILERSKKKMP